MVKPGACVIDVGITRITTESGKEKLVGDVDFEGRMIFFFYNILNITFICPRIYKIPFSK